MSIRTFKILYCDGENCDRKYSQSTALINRGIREEAEIKLGWKIRKNKDYCPECYIKEIKKL